MSTQGRTEAIEVKAKSIAIILAASIAFIALLGCVENIPDSYCIGEGETIPVIANPPECCAGLTLIPPKQADILGISGICTAKCGNGVCDRAIETFYNCLEDCEGCTETCVPAPPYCPGGTLIAQERTDDCGCPLPPTCCGNGTCDEAAAESNENCPQDCAAAEAQDYYDSEQQAFDALAEEINGLEEPSPSELESMLGQ